MNPEELQKNIALYYSKLPSNAQAAFSKMEWLQTLTQLSEKYALNDTQIETLGTETTLVLLGIIHFEEYQRVVKKELDISKEVSDKLLAEIDISIISAIRPELEDAFKSNNTKPAPDITQTLDERLSSLPEDVKKSINESNYQTTLYDIAQEQKLSIEQMGELEESVVSVMLDGKRLDQFERTIKNSLQVPEDKAKAITATINERIFTKIRGKVISMYKTPEEVKENIATVSIEPSMSTPPRLDSLEIAAPEVHPMIAQKFFDPLKVPVKKNEQNVKTETIKTSVVLEKTNTAHLTAPKAATYTNGDPYRLSPDE